MPQAKLLSIPLKYGRSDQIDQRHAPFGVLAECQNMRVRKDGRLGVRNGYIQQNMLSGAGTVTAYDIFEHQGRLAIIGTDFADGFPVDVFELVNGAFAWRGSDPDLNMTLSPFTYPRETCGVSQVGEGVVQMSCAVGGGFAAMVWKPLASNDLFVIIERQSNGQVVHAGKLSAAGFSAQICFSVDTFYAQLALNSGDVTILQFTPGTHNVFTAFATHVAGGSVSLAHDIVPVSGATTGRVTSAVGKAGTTSTTIKSYTSAGAQVGATITVSQTAISVCVESNQTDNTVNLYTVTGTVTGQIRTFNFTTAALTLGPTATTTGANGSMCRLPTLGAFVQAIAVAVNDASSNVVVQTFNQSAHTLLTTFTVQKALLRTRLLNAQSGTQKRAVVFGGMVAPALPLIADAASNAPNATNALIYVSTTTGLMSTRDLGRAVESAPLSTGLIPNLQADASTRRLGWVCARASIVGLAGAGIGQPVMTLFDFQKPARRQVAQYAGLTYLSGGTVQTYDGTFPAELLFNELPGIYSVTQGGGGGLVSGARYTYVHHWEYTRADGSLEQSALSAPITVTMGALNTANTVSVTGPHSVRVARGGSLFGSSVVSVLSRTVWDAVTGTTGSDLRRCSVVVVPTGMANFGAAVSHVDQVSDAALAQQAVVYTQAARGAQSGPLPHDAPRGCAYIAVDASRMVLGGLSAPFQLQVSKGAFLGEPFEFSEFSTFFSQVARPVTAVATLDTAKVPFTTEEVYAQFGDGPDDQGGGGLSAPQEVPTCSGLKDWRSVLKYDGGVFFQAQDRQIYKLPRGAGSPTLAAAEIEDLLASFPVISAACKHRADNALLFACNNSGLTSARFAVLDARTNIWTTDLPALSAGAGVESMVNFGDTLGYISGGVVFLQDASAFNDLVSGTATFIPMLLKTKPVYPFGVGGKGTITDILVCGEYAGDVSLVCRVSLDDGLSFTPMTGFAITSAQYAAGEVMRKQFTLPVAAEAGSVVIELSTTTPGFAGTQQVAFEEIVVLGIPEPGLVNLEPADYGTGA